MHWGLSFLCVAVPCRSKKNIHNVLHKESVRRHSFKCNRHYHCSCTQTRPPPSSKTVTLCSYVQPNQTLPKACFSPVFVPECMQLRESYIVWNMSCSSTPLIYVNNMLHSKRDWERKSERETEESPSITHLIYTSSLSRSVCVCMCTECFMHGVSKCSCWCKTADWWFQLLCSQLPSKLSPRPS